MINKPDYTSIPGAIIDDEQVTDSLFRAYCKSMHSGKDQYTTRQRNYLIKIGYAAIRNGKFIHVYQQIVESPELPKKPKETVHKELDLILESIVEKFNSITGKNVKMSQWLKEQLRSRINTKNPYKRVGNKYCVEDFIAVISMKWVRWGKNPELAQYIQNFSTIIRPKNFARYVAEWESLTKDQQMQFLLLKDPFTNKPKKIVYTK